MGEVTDVRWLSYEAAAKRVGRSTRNIRRWRAEGMPMSWHVGSDGQRERVVHEDVLLAWHRDRLKASPVNYYRVRRLMRADGLPDPTPPPWLGGHSAGRTAPPAPEDPPTIVPVPVVDVTFTGGAAEYTALRAALVDNRASCEGIDAFTADHVDAGERAMLAAICADCDVLEQCRAFAAAHQPAGGYWPS